jgi:methionine sulfoxide reductase heme-binding subunit
MALWYLMRGTGAAALVLLTAAMVLGIVNVRRWAPQGVPRFVVDDLHRTVALLAVALLAVHVVTAVVDSYVPIAVVSVLIPFDGGYRPLWVGLGALALDLFIALIVTSLLRGRLGLRTWRAVHWLAYACWSLAFAHSVGIGTDVAAGWMLWVALGCAAAVLAAVALRLAETAALPAGAR